MLKVEGVVTYATAKEGKEGKPYGMVSIEGLFCFADPANLPTRGDTIIGAVQVNTSGEGDNRRTSMNLFSWQKNGNGQH